MPGGRHVCRTHVFLYHKYFLFAHLANIPFTFQLHWTVSILLIIAWREGRRVPSYYLVNSGVLLLSVSIHEEVQSPLPFTPTGARLWALELEGFKAVDSSHIAYFLLRLLRPLELRLVKPSEQNK
jgi:hypothetical protein